MAVSSQPTRWTQRFIRVSVEAYDGTPGNRVHRSVSMDFQLVKRIEYAVLSRSRVMIGRNVMIEGRVGSTFKPRPT